jgi:hypothetical protein
LLPPSQGTRRRQRGRERLSDAFCFAEKRYQKATTDEKDIVQMVGMRYDKLSRQAFLTSFFDKLFGQAFWKASYGHVYILGLYEKYFPRRWHGQTDSGVKTIEPVLAVVKRGYEGLSRVLNTRVGISLGLPSG